MSKTKLSISLIKSGITDLEEMVKVDGCNHKELPGVGHIYCSESQLKYPGWIEDYSLGHLGDELKSKMKTSFVQAILFIQRDYLEETRYFAIAFGYGRNPLIPGAIEPRFGLRTTLTP